MEYSMQPTVTLSNILLACHNNKKMQKKTPLNLISIFANGFWHSTRKIKFFTVIYYIITAMPAYIQTQTHNILCLSRFSGIFFFVVID